MVVYDTVLVRYGELSTKGKNRNIFIRKLLDNIKSSLKDLEKLEYRYTRDRIYIKINGEDSKEIEERLKNVFGISSFSFTCKINSDIEEIKKITLELVKNLETSTFKVITKRQDKTFELNSDKVNRATAGNILANTNHKVDVHNPNIRINIEIQKENTYITSNKIEGAKGYPTGVNGKVLLLLSGGIDSPLAAYYIMKRGIEVEAVHFASPPYTSKQSFDKVVELARIVSKYQGKMKIHVVNFTDLQMEIYARCDESYAITIMRRMMYRIAEKLALKRNCLAIATGENVGQVASQTLESLAVINEVIKMPVIRPLITFDKIDIINMSRMIGTYETSILPYEDCCTIFTPKNPVTKPKSTKAVYYEKNIDYDTLIDNSIENIETVLVLPNEVKDEYL